MKLRERAILPSERELHERMSTRKQDDVFMYTESGPVVRMSAKEYKDLRINQILADIELTH